MIVDLPHWVGDVLMSLPALERLLEINPGLTVLAPPPVADLLESLYPNIKVVTRPYKELPWRTAARLGRRFNHGVTFRNSTRAAILLRLVSRKFLGGPNKGSRSQHQVHDLDHLLMKMGMEPASPRLSLAKLPPRPQSAAGENKVALMPAAAWSDSKAWPPKHFSDLACLLKKEGFSPVVVVGPGEEPVAMKVVKGAADTGIEVMGPQLSLRELLRELSLSFSAAIGNDTGLLHLASLAGLPVVGLYGPTDPKRTLPIFAPSVAATLHLPCAPCFKRQCPLGHRRCLDQLLPDAVLRLFRVLIQCPSPKLSK